MDQKNPTFQVPNTRRTNQLKPNSGSKASKTSISQRKAPNHAETKGNFPEKGNTDSPAAERDFRPNPPPSSDCDVIPARSGLRRTLKSLQSLPREGREKKSLPAVRTINGNREERSQKELKVKSHKAPYFLFRPRWKLYSPIRPFLPTFRFHASDLLLPFRNFTRRKGVYENFPSYITTVRSSVGAFQDSRRHRRLKSAVLRSAKVRSVASRRECESWQIII